MARSSRAQDDRVRGARQGALLDSGTLDRHPTLAEHLATFRARVRPAWRLALLASSFCAVVAAGLVARRGTTAFRVGAATLVGSVVLGFAVARLRDRRATRRRDLVVKRLLVREDRALYQRILRALALEDQAVAGVDVGSLSLARLHASRAIARIPRDLSRARGERFASRLRLGALLFALLGAGAVVSDPARVIEGLDVLAARRGVAPLSLPWLDGLSVLVQAPPYLRLADRHADPSGSQAPVGSTLVVRGIPARPGRRLVLTDGHEEVAFGSEGGEGVVARFAVKDHVELFVAARFGDVLLREPEPIRIAAVPDAAPRVLLDGAPRTVDLEGLGRLELAYRATDDHGLRQIDLVLRSGGREERRVLEKLDGQGRTEQGAQALDAGDPFVRRMFLPVLVTIEAKDNDVLSGAKWGRSEPVTIRPPPVGAPEAARYLSLVEARGAVLDVLAWLAVEGAEADAATRRRGLGERRAVAAQALRTAGVSSVGAARFPQGLRTFLVGQARRLEMPPRAKSASEGVEDVALAVDSAVRAFGTRDARGVAKRLGDVAEEAADAFADGRTSERAALATERAQAALAVLDVGRGNLAVLDELGDDLASVTRGELARIRRAVADHSLYHAELAARHLAARLRRPDPSFSVAGGNGAGGVESGGGFRRGRRQRSSFRRQSPLR